MESSKLSPYCWAWNRVYVKSNGRVPCWCDMGEHHTIVEKDLSQVDFVRDIVNGPEMREMRLKVLQEGKYYVKECANCGCMSDNRRGEWYRYKDGSQPDLDNQQKKINTALDHLYKVQKERGWEFGSIDFIEEMQIEPSFLCSLRCQGCVHGTHATPLKTEAAPYILDLQWLKQMTMSLLLNKIEVKHISFVGRGEPTLNRTYPEMLKILRMALPKTFMFMDTNCNQPFKDEYLLLSQINCSVDGAFSHTYPLYRVQGKLDLAFQFMETAVKRKRELGSQTQIVWKYILFDTTDDDEQIAEAQKMAKKIGVDKLEFIITAASGTTVGVSKRFFSIEDVNSYLLSKESSTITSTRRT